jgi:cytochrome b involved in lipid metabolism
MDRSKLKPFTMDEIKYMNGKNDKRLYILIGGLVYDVTDFDHPGGSSVYEDNTFDLQDEFDNVGHSMSATSQMKKYLIGKLQE